MTTAARVNITTLVNSSKIRRETRDGREVIIVPSATLPDNVVMNGKSNGNNRGGILYPAEEIERSYAMLEGAPAPLGHPMVNGKFVLARSPEGLARSYVGAHNENVRREGGRVHLDKVIDVEVANQSERGRTLLSAIEKQEPIHTSTGLAVANLKEAADGLPYKYIALGMMLEHDAILLDEEGAAGPDQGVGIFVNASGEQVEVINSYYDDADRSIDAEIGYALDSMLRVQERKERQPLIDRIKSFMNKVVQGDPTPDDTLEGVALNTQEEHMDKEHFDALQLKVNALTETVDSMPTVVATAVANALKPFTDAQEARDARDKEALEAEHATLVNRAVEAGVLDEATAKDAPVAVLNALLSREPLPAMRVNGAYKPAGEFAHLAELPE